MASFDYQQHKTTNIIKKNLAFRRTNICRSSGALSASLTWAVSNLMLLLLVGCFQFALDCFEVAVYLSSGQSFICSLKPQPLWKCRQLIAYTFSFKNISCHQCRRHQLFQGNVNRPGDQFW